MRQQIIAIGQRLQQQGLIRASCGNISCRLAGGSVLITAAGTDKGRLGESDILQVGGPGRVSSETALHQAIYAACPDCAAIVHAHPPYATALATAGLELDWRLLEESRLFLGPVPRIAALEAGSAELARAARDAAKGANALLLTAHGAVCWGGDLAEAASRLEVLEHTARVMLYTKLFGTGQGHV